MTDPVELDCKLNPNYQAIDIRVKRDIVGRLKSSAASAVDSIMLLPPLSRCKDTTKKVVRTKEVGRKEVLRRELITGWKKAKKTAKLEREMVR